MLDILKWVFVGLISLMVIFALLNKFGFGKVLLTKKEVVEILQSLLDDSAGEWALDDFISVEIKDPRLDEVRKEVAQIVDRYENWETQYAFPPEAKPELEQLLQKLNH